MSAETSGCGALSLRKLKGFQGEAPEIACGLWSPGGTDTAGGIHISVSVNKMLESQMSS